jgi:hypothetical protein
VTHGPDTPEVIGEALCRLAGEGRALAERDAWEVVEVAGAVLELWRDPSSPWRTQLEHELPAVTGFSPEVVRAGLSRALDGWSDEGLRRLVRSELGSFHPYRDPKDVAVMPRSAAGFETTAVLLAGAIPMPTILALLLPLLLRSPVLAKAPASDPLTAQLVAQSVASVDAQLGRCIGVVDFRGSDDDAARAFLRAPCVVAYGSDETMDAVAARTSAAQRVVRYGHRVSFGVLGEEVGEGDALRPVAEALALDVSLWDQLGCLSPAALYVVDSKGGLASRVATELAGALDRLSPELPRGSVDAATKAAIAHARSEAELRAANDERTQLHANAERGYTVVLEPDARARPTPLHRFVRVHPVGSREELAEALAPHAARLSAVAMAGFGANAQQVARALVALGASRVCAARASSSATRPRAKCWGCRRRRPWEPNWRACCRSRAASRR